MRSRGRKSIEQASHKGRKNVKESESKRIEHVFDLETYYDN